jgi:hypothetical protein
MIRADGEFVFERPIQERALYQIIVDTGAVQVDLNLEKKVIDLAREIKCVEDDFHFVLEAKIQVLLKDKAHAKKNKKKKKKKKEVQLHLNHVEWELEELEIVGREVNEWNGKERVVESKYSCRAEFQGMCHHIVWAFGPVEMEIGVCKKVRTRLAHAPPHACILYLHTYPLTFHSPVTHPRSLYPCSVHHRLTHVPRPLSPFWRAS